MLGSRKPRGRAHGPEKFFLHPHMKSIKLLRQLSTSVIALAVTATLFTACSSGPTIGFESNKDANLSNLKTYAVLPLPTKIEGSDPGAGLRYAQPIQQEVRAGMASLGYTEAPLDQADLVLNVRGSVVPKVDVTNYGYSYAGYGRWGGMYGGGYPMGGTSVYQYEEGTLTIEGFERTSKALVWIGWATDELASTPKEENLRAAVRGIVAKFPPVTR
jgi:hypothetical protein